MTNKEDWKDVIGYEGLYQVSNFGNIRSMNYYRVEGRIKLLKLNEDTRGYYRIKLYKNQTKETLKVHRLVAQHFIPNPNNYKYINHIDENPKNNNSDNLEWCTMFYNNHYGERNNKIRESRYKAVNQYDLYGRFIKTYEGAIFAEDDGFNRSGICNCISGRIKSHKGYLWSHKED